MEFSLQRTTNFKSKNALSAGDCIREEIQTKIQTKINSNSKKLIENKIIGNGDATAYEENAERDIENCDTESAYEDSFCSEISENESESINNQCHSSNEIPSCQFKTSKSVIKKQESSNGCKRYASTSKICEIASFTVENRVKCLSLNEVRPSKTTNIRNTRKNMSFTNDEITKIEKDNELLLRKIMAQQRPPKIKVPFVHPKLSSSAINRKRLQKKIEEDNMVLLRRLQQTKACVLNTNKIPGYRATRL